MEVMNREGNAHMSTPDQPSVPQVADATGGEEELVQTIFPEDEYPDPPQNDTDLGREVDE